MRDGVFITGEITCGLLYLYWHENTEVKRRGNGKMFGFFDMKTLCSYHEHAQDEETIKACSGSK